MNKLRGFNGFVVSLGQYDLYSKSWLVEITIQLLFENLVIFFRLKIYTCINVLKMPNNRCSDE